MATEIKLPALKENVDTVEVNAVRCAPGDTVAKDQVLLEVQADKTALDVPSPSAGRVSEVRVKVGEQIKVGQVICLIEGGGNGEAPKSAPAKKAAAPAEPMKAKQTETPAQAPKVAAPMPAVSPIMAPAVNRVTAAGPATRRLARELGIDLSQVAGSGRAGRVIEEDVKTYVRQLASNGTAAPSVGGGVQAPPLPNFEQ
jgi:pyruvate dehydrogenase E2 component (dihydrolipoamide acetyltransferase)